MIPGVPDHDWAGPLRSEGRAAPRAALVQYAHGDMHVRMLDAGVANNRRYCTSWRAEYIVDRSPPRAGRRAHFEKIRVLKAAIAAGFDIVVWIDADCVIVDHATNIFATAVTEIGLCECFDSPRQPRHFSTGVMVLRNGPRTRAFLDAWEAAEDDGHPSADQQTFALMMRQRDWRRLVTILPNRFNMSPVNMEDPEPVILAAHNHVRRPDIVLEWLDQLHAGKMPTWSAPAVPAGPVTRQAVLRYLACEFAVGSNSAEFIDRLQQLAPDARQGHKLSRHYSFTCLAGPGGYRIDGGAAGESVEPDVNGAANALLTRMSLLALEALPSYVRLRAAVGRYRGRGFLLAGAPASGKTTLAVSLMLDGIDMSGDEIALLADRHATAFPRRFNLRQASLGLLPGLTDYRGARAAAGPGATMEIPFDPTVLGQPWHIEAAPVAAVFLIAPVWNGPTRVVPITKIEMARSLLPLSNFEACGAGRGLAEISATLEVAETALIEPGAPESAARAIRTILEALPPVDAR